MNKKFLSVLGLISIGVVGRLVPHLPNATPMTTITLAAGKYVGRVATILIPLIAMVLSDAVIGFYNWKILISVYASFALIGLSGILARKYPGMFPTGLVLISSSLLFFLATNFSVWLFSPWYAKSIAGLFYCYELGLPFMRNMLLGDITYSLVLFGAIECVRMLWAKRQLVLKGA